MVLVYWYKVGKTEDTWYLVVDEDILKKVQFIRQRPRPGVKVEGEGGRWKPQSFVQNI